MTSIRHTPGHHPLDSAARAGLWLLPVHAVLLALSTLTSQPDPSTAFPDYARYVTTDVFLLSHLLAPTAAGNVVTSAVSGAAAFAQPAVGRAYLRGAPDAAAIDADVYGPALFATAAVGLLLLIAGAVAFGSAVARSGPGLRWAGVAYAVRLPRAAGFSTGT